MGKICLLSLRDPLASSSTFSRGERKLYCLSFIMAVFVSVPDCYVRFEANNWSKMQLVCPHWPEGTIQKRLAYKDMPGRNLPLLSSGGIIIENPRSLILAKFPDCQLNEECPHNDITSFLGKLNIAKYDCQYNGFKHSQSESLHEQGCINPVFKYFTGKCKTCIKLKAQSSTSSTALTSYTPSKKEKIEQ